MDLPGGGDTIQPTIRGFLSGLSIFLIVSLLVVLRLLATGFVLCLVCCLRYMYILILDFTFPP